jgi:hypothetical protein
MPDDERPEPLHSGYGSRPIPDPTILTTQQLFQAIASLKEFLVAKIDAIEGKLSQRIDGMDEATELLRTRSDRVPSEVDKAVTALRTLVDERLAGFRMNTETSIKDATEARATLERKFTEQVTAVDRSSEFRREGVMMQVTGLERTLTAQIVANDKALTLANETSKHEFELLHRQLEGIQTQIMALATSNEVDSKIGGISERLALSTQNAADKLDGPTGLQMKVQGLIERMGGRSEAVHESAQNRAWIVATAIGLLTVVLGGIALFVHSAPSSSQQTQPQVIYAYPPGEAASPSNSTITTPLAPGTTIPEPRR